MSWPVLRIARPTDQLEAVAAFYRDAVGLTEFGRFADHDGFDGVMLGHPKAPWHLEFTHAHGHLAGRAPSQDNLLVLYMPEAENWQRAINRMTEAGHAPVAAFNPYWDRCGQTYQDPDGYRIVFARTAWTG